MRYLLVAVIALALRRGPYLNHLTSSLSPTSLQPAASRLPMHVITALESPLVFHREITLALRSLIVTEMRFNDARR
jgi:hypothetical protein